MAAFAKALAILFAVRLCRFSSCDLTTSAAISSSKRLSNSPSVPAMTTSPGTRSTRKLCVISRGSPALARPIWRGQLNRFCCSGEWKATTPSLTSKNPLSPMLATVSEFPTTSPIQAVEVPLAVVSASALPSTSIRGHPDGLSLSLSFLFCPVLRWQRRGVRSAAAVASMSLPALRDISVGVKRGQNPNVGVEADVSKHWGEKRTKPKHGGFPDYYPFLIPSPAWLPRFVP